MNLIKKIIAWILSLIKKIFGKKKKRIIKKQDTNIMESQVSKNKIKGSGLESMPDTLPSYMLISDQEKAELVNKIRGMRGALLNDNKIKEQSIEKIVEILNDNFSDKSEYSVDNIQKYLIEQDFSKLSPRKINALLEGYDDDTKEKINDIVEESRVATRAIVASADNLETIAEYIEDNDISFVTRDLINEQILDNEEKIVDSPKQVAVYDKDILDTIKKWDQGIIDKAKLEYDVVNYVTISNVMIDEILEEYDKIIDDYQHRRYNRRYYEEQLNKIKEKIDYLRNIKNTGAVSDEIDRLRKELYTKSKDKYDILYNNEIFIDVDKKCDELLEKVNRKVVDIRTKEKVPENKEIEEKKEQEEYWEKILLRFQDLSLSQRIILLHQEMRLGNVDYIHVYKYVNGIYDDFMNGVDGPFNYERNRVKTELVNLYNDLSIIIANQEKKPLVMVDHINFRMEDLVDAVEIKKYEVEKSLNTKGLPNSELVDEKLENIRDKYINNRVGEKTFSKGSRRSA